MRERSAVRRVLVTRLRFLGDVVLSTPLLEHLREQCPDASIEYLVDARFAPLLEGLPTLDVIHRLAPEAGWQETLRLTRRLRRPRIDWWFDLFTNPRSCILAAMAAPRRGVGSPRGLRSRVYAHRRGRPEGDPSAIRHHLDKLTPLLGSCELRPPRLVVNEADRVECARRLDLTGAERPILLNPGSTWPDKSWPAGQWPLLVQRLRAAAAGPVWLLTPPGEEEAAQCIAEAAGIRCLPVLALRPLLALLERARLYIGNDGGVMHCAVALQIPTVALFGPTEPAIWFPYEGWGPYRVLRAPAQKLSELAVTEVADAAAALLSEVSAR
jgi:ADP-heptose:LPS heptosyltransferase